MRRALAVAFLVAISLPCAARDLARQNYLLGERAAGMGGAFISLTGDAASTYYNPAGLAGQLKKGISLSASAYSAHIENYSDLINVDMGAGQPALQTDMKSFSFSTFPSSMIYVLPLGTGAGDQPPPIRHVLAFSVIIPDYDKLDAVIDMPAKDYLWEMKGSYIFDEKTYWVGPTYSVGVGGWFRAGLSVFALAHMTSSNTKQGIKAVWSDNSSTYASFVEEQSATAVTALAQAGVQLTFAERFNVGFTVRSPTLGDLYSSAKALQFNSVMEADSLGTTTTSYVDRIEASKGLTARYRLPLMVGIGVSYSKPESYTLALDGSWYARLPSYKSLEGDLVYPTDAAGAPILDPARALDPTFSTSSESVFNANLGAEFSITPKHVARLGLFTNFSTVATADNTVGNPKVNSYGATLGVGIKGERSTTSFGVVYVGGTGDTTGLNDLFGETPNKSRVSMHTITAVLSGSADL